MAFAPYLTFIKSLKHGFRSIVQHPSCIYRWSYSSIRHDSTKTSICCMKRVNFPRMYPTLMVLPDGSSITVRYREPRQIITMPLDLTTLTAEERQKRLARRRPRSKIIMDEYEEDNFDMNKYVNIIKSST